MLINMNKRKTLLYPYSAQFSSVLRHKELLPNHYISAVVSPVGWGITGKDAGVADSGYEIGMIVNKDFEESLNLCDAVIFCESVYDLDFDTILFPQILRAIQCKKDIVITIPIDKEKRNLISHHANLNGISVSFYGNDDSEIEYTIPESNYIYNIDTPVVFVLGMGDRTNKFDIQLSLRENIQKMGYKISQIGSKRYCELLGFHSFPSFMYSTKLTETNKIIMFNYFIKNIEKIENPDLIIIGIPGGILPMNEKITDNFGIFPYEVSQAVVPDLTVFSCYQSDYTEEFFRELKNLVKYRFNNNIECFNISNAVIDSADVMYGGVKTYFNVFSEYVDDKNKLYNSYGQKVFNILNQADNKKMSEHIIDLLGSYGQSICI